MNIENKITQLQNWLNQQNHHKKIQFLFKRHNDKKKKLIFYWFYIYSTWFRSWWGWRRGSVSDLALELELLGKLLLPWFFFEAPLGYRNELDRSNCRFCWCCLYSKAAAIACSRIDASSSFFFSLRLVERSFLDEDGDCWWCVVLRSAQRFPIGEGACKGGCGWGKMREVGEERESGERERDLWDVNVYVFVYRKLHFMIQNKSILK